MEIINAATTESGAFQGPNLDLRDFLEFLMQNGIKYDKVVVYYDDKDVINQFYRFLGTYFVNIREKEQICCDNYDDFTSMSQNISRDFLNYGEINLYKRHIPSGKMSMETILWVNLKDIELHSDKQFKKISFWQTYGDLVREYGKRNF